MEIAADRKKNWSGKRRKTEESGGFATEMAREATAPEFLTVLMSISLAFNTKEREI